MKGIFSYTIVGATLAVISLSSCTIQDPEYKALAPRVDRNVSADAIVGMWFDANPVAWSGNRTSALFTRDGKVVTRTVLSVDRTNPLENSLDWRYVGNGEWQTKSYGDATRWHIADGKLLQTSKGAFGVSHWVYVRADSDDAVLEEKKGR